MNQFLSLFLMQGQEGSKSSGMSSLIMFGAIFIVFYFFMIRPQMKKQKKLKSFRESLKTGDKIVTVGGLHGKVIAVNENDIELEIANNTKVKIERTAVAQEFSEQDLGKK